MSKNQSDQNASVLLKTNDISKSYPGVKALDKVSLSLEKGKVHALLGENGAGKSTLIKIISGVISPDEGTMHINEQPVSFINPRQAFSSGINVVHQERNVVTTFTVGENILLDAIAAKDFKIINKEQIYQDSREFLDMVGLEISPSRIVEDLSVAEIQLIEIARALSSRANILLLDEPTASLSLNEAESLLKTIRKLRDQGVAFLYVTHKIEEVFEIADMVTVLRDGKKVESTLPIHELDRSKLVSLMVGRPENVEPFPVRQFQNKKPALEVKNLKSKFSPYEDSFTLIEGEILGWYGLVGAGRTELARALIGYDPATGGNIYVKGKAAKIRSLSEALYRWGIGYLSESRKEEGLFLSHPITRNIAASVWRKIRNRIGLLRIGAEDRLADYYSKKLAIKASSIYQIINTLSGGNQQKVNFAKTLATEPEILIVDEPTVGIDVNTKRQIHELIWDLSKEGISIILISSDMPEIIQLTDRILVFSEGQICGELKNTKDYKHMSKQIIGLCLKEEGLTG